MINEKSAHSKKKLTAAEKKEHKFANDIIMTSQKIMLETGT